MGYPLSMNPIAAILATAAVTAGSIKAAEALRKRRRRASENLNWLRKRRSGRTDGAVIDLEVDAETGVYGLRDGR